jgi:hypothetical protein
MKRYECSPTVARLLLTYNQFKVNCLLGPIGGGKTVGIIMTLVNIMHAQKPDANGVRRTRFAVVRNTRQQLKDSVIKSVHDWLPPNGSSVVWKETEMTQILTYQLADGTTVRSEWMFRSLDNEDDARKLLSVEYTAGWLSEFREIPFQLLTDLRSRMGRYPAMTDGGATWSGVLAESNMPVEGSDWHQMLEIDTPLWMQRLIQPAAMIPDPAKQGHWLPNPTAENTKWLVPRYYEDLAIGSTKYWMQSMLLCEYPPSLDGKAVYGQTFKKAIHVSEENLRPFQFQDFSPSLIIGIDQGRNPAAVIGQTQNNGTLFILRELIGSNMGMDRFASEILRPALNVAEFMGIPVLCVIDPAGLQKSQVNDLTPKDVLEHAGFRVIPAPTNDPLRRIEAVERKFEKQGGILIDPRCKELIRGLAAEYRFRAKKNGELEDRPEKKHPVSDLQDSLQYLCLVAGGVNYGRVINTVMSPPRKQIKPPRGAWT